MSDPVESIAFEETDCKRVIELQRLLLSAAEDADRVPMVVTAINNMLELSSPGLCDQFVLNVIVCARSRPLQLDVYARILSGINTVARPRYLKSALLKRLFTTAGSADPLMCTHKTGLIYRCLVHGLFTESEIAENMRAFYRDYSEFIEYIAMIFCWFAPEIERVDKELFDELVQAYEEGQKKWNFCLALKVFYDQIDDLRAGDWEEYLDCRENMYRYDSVFSAVIRDDAEQLADLVLCDSEEALNQRYPNSVWAVCSLFMNKPSLIEVAAFCRSRRCFLYLLLNGADVDLMDSNRMSAMHAAVAGGNTEVIRMLDEREEVSYDGCIQIAALFHQLDIFYWLIEQRQCDVFICHPIFQTYLHAAALSNNLEVLEYSIEGGCVGMSVNTVDDLSVCFAFTIRHLCITQLLLVVLIRCTCLYQINRHWCVRQMITNRHHSTLPQVQAFLISQSCCCSKDRI